jgi:hypothetical protein
MMVFMAIDRKTFCLIEVAAFALLLESYMWAWQGAFPGALWTVIGGGILFVAVSNVTHSDALRALGIRADNLLESVFEVGTATVIISILLAGTGWLLGTLRPIEDWETSRIPWIFFWALVQQYALQDFVLQRMTEAFPNPRTAALASAGVFAFLHLPNPPLALGTGIIGFVWCRLFQRHPNLFTVSLSHTILAVVLAHSFPRAWLHGMKVGPGYFNF